LKENAVKFGVPLPGRLPNHRNVKLTLLPLDKTNADIHQIYQEATKTLNYRVISLSEFKKAMVGTVSTNNTHETCY
jgi:hypothetical protein